VQFNRFREAEVMVRSGVQLDRVHGIQPEFDMSQDSHFFQAPQFTNKPLFFSQFS
jgi:hypothetical protein